MYICIHDITTSYIYLYCSISYRTTMSPGRRRAHPWGRLGVHYQVPWYYVILYYILLYIIYIYIYDSIVCYIISYYIILYYYRWTGGPLRPVHLLRTSLLRVLESSFPEIIRTWEFPPLRIKSLLESNPSKPKLLVGGLGIPDASIWSYIILESIYY